MSRPSLEQLPGAAWTDAGVLGGYEAAGREALAIAAWSRAHQDRRGDAQVLAARDPAGLAVGFLLDRDCLREMVVRPGLDTALLAAAYRELLASGLVGRIRLRTDDSLLLPLALDGRDVGGTRCVGEYLVPPGEEPQPGPWAEVRGHDATRWVRSAAELRAAGRRPFLAWEADGDAAMERSPELTAAGFVMRVQLREVNVADEPQVTPR